MLEYFKKILKESFIIVLISALIGLISGSLLSLNSKIFYAIPIILLILPALNSLIGDITTILISRLTSRFYLGSLTPKLEKSDRLLIDFFGLLITIMLALGFLIVLSYTISIATNILLVNPFLIICILILSVFILFIILFIFSLISAIILFKRGKDPNHFLIPLTTTLIDFLNPLLLIIFIKIFI